MCFPEYVLFVDEVSNNTCMSEDRQVDGQQCLGTIKGDTMKIASSIKESRWTLLGFTNAKGEPVLCAIIFASETITDEETLGFDIFAKVKGDLSDVKSNYGQKSLSWRSQMYY